MRPWLFLLLPLLTAFAPNQEPPPKVKLAPAEDLQGYYTCEGKDDTESYSGIAIIKRHEGVYVVQWVIPGSVSYMGCGIKRDNKLAVGWAYPGADGKQFRGVHVFDIKGPKLVGQWASIPGTGKVHPESLTFLKALPE